jgi:hypothetical protein
MATFLCWITTSLIVLSVGSSDLVGSWKLVSLNGKQQASSQMRVTEDHGVLTVEKSSDSTSAGPIRRQYNVDGKEFTEPMPRGNERVSRTKWEKDSLQVKSTIRAKRSGASDLASPMNSVAIDESQKWTLSADGKTLTIVTKLSGIVDSKTIEVYERE